MNIDFALTYVFDDKGWFGKLFIGGGLATGAFVLSPFLIGLLILLPIGGYLFVTLKNVRDQHPAPLPNWWSNPGDLFIKGLVVFIIWLIYNLPALLVAGTSVGVNIASPWLNPDIAATLGLAGIGLGCVQFAFSLLGSFLLPGALIRYAQYGRFTAAFRIDRILGFIKDNAGDYIIAALVSWIGQLAAVTGLIFFGVGVFFTLFWAALVSAGLYGQLARRTTRVRVHRICLYPVAPRQITARITPMALPPGRPR